MSGMRSPKHLHTCSAVVGESGFEELALDAAKGKSHSRITAWIKGWLGQRTPTVGPPAVTMSGMAFARGRTNVNGPGQNARPNFSATAGHSVTHRLASSRLEMWTIIGL